MNRHQPLREKHVERTTKPTSRTHFHFRRASGSRFFLPRPLFVTRPSAGVSTMTTDSSRGVSDAAATSDGTEADDYRKAVLTLRVVKLALGALVSALTVLRLLGVV